MRPGAGERVMYPCARLLSPSATWPGAAGARAMLYATAACARPSPRLTIVIPALNEGSVIAELVASLAPLRVRGVEVVVVDGGSTDGTAEAAGPGADRVIVAPCGRARQRNAGAAVAHAPVLLLLHADTRLPAHADLLIVSGPGAAGLHGGRFAVP